MKRFNGNKRVAGKSRPACKLIKRIENQKPEVYHPASMAVHASSFPHITMRKIASKLLHRIDQGVATADSSGGDASSIRSTLKYSPGFAKS